MGRKCLWTRAQTSWWIWAGILHNSKRFGEIRHVSNNKTETFHNNILQLPPPPPRFPSLCFVCVCVLHACECEYFSVLQTTFRKVKSQMQMQPLEAVDTHSDGFSCMQRCGPPKVRPFSCDPGYNREIWWTPPPQKKKERKWKKKLHMIQFVCGLSGDTLQSSTCGTRTCKRRQRFLNNPFI